MVNGETGEIIIPANRKITKTLLRKLAEVYDRIEIDPSPIRNKINEIIGSFKKKFDDLQMQYDEEMERAEAGEGRRRHHQVGEGLHRLEAQAVGR